jgi:hypothetical protein
VSADLSIVEGREKDVVLRGNLVQGTVLFVAVEALSSGEKAFSLGVVVLSERGAATP